MDLAEGSARRGPCAAVTTQSLALPYGAAGKSQQPPDVLAARPGARRLLYHQRHAVGARGAERIRPLARSRQRRLGIRRRAALPQAAGGLRPGRWHAWQAWSGAHIQVRAQYAGRRVPQSLHRSRRTGHPRLQRRPIRGRRLSAEQYQARPAVWRPRGLSATRRAADRTCASARVREPTASASRRAAPSAWNTASAASAVLPAPRAR